MSGRSAWPLPAIACLVAACGGSDVKGSAEQPKIVVSADQAEAETLGRGVL